MTIRKKTLLLVVVTQVALIMVLYLSLSAILRQSYAIAERQNVISNMQRVTTAYRSEESQLKNLLENWAWWNDTYQFIQSDDAAYQQSNLTPASIQGLKVNFMVYMRKDGKLLFAARNDTANNRLMPLTASEKGVFSTASPLLTFKSLEQVNTGVVMFGNQPVLVSAAQILTSNDTGPPQGYLIFGRDIGSAMLTSIRNLTQLNVSMALFKQGSTQRFKEAFSHLTILNPKFTQPVSNTQINGYQLMPDIFGRPSIVFFVKLSRDIHAEGERGLEFLLFSLIFSGIVFIGLTLLILDRLVLSRIVQLIFGVGRIRSKEDLAMRLDLPGKDELSDLAMNINRMLRDLEESLQREQELKQQVIDLKIEIDEVKRKREVKQIVESDYFQDIQKKAEEIRKSRTQQEGDHRDTI